MKEEMLNKLSKELQENFNNFRKENNFVSLDEQLKNAKTSDDFKIIKSKIANRQELTKGLTNESIKRLTLTKTGFINMFALIGLITTVSSIGVLIGYVLFKLKFGA